MKLVCPSCGATASADSWVNDLTTREALQLLSQIPSPISKVVLSYMSLFRASKTKALSWKKTHRLLGEISELVSKGYVSRQGLPDRKCTASQWARAMEEMIGKSDYLTKPMPNHNYLKKVAYDLADQSDYAAEKTASQTPVTRPAPARRGADPLEAARKKWDEKHGTSTAVDIASLGDIVKGMD